MYSRTYLTSIFFCFQSTCCFFAPIAATEAPVAATVLAMAVAVTSSTTCTAAAVGTATAEAGDSGCWVWVWVWVCCSLCNELANWQ